MLYTDGTWINVDDLLAADSDIASVADTESIDLEGALKRVTGECGQDLLTALVNFSMSGSQNLSGVHINAVLGNSSVSSRARLGQIVAHSLSPGINSPIKTWVTYSILAALYLDARSGKNGERYDLRLERFSKRADDAWLMLCELGIPIVNYPLPCPGAVFEPEMGTWDKQLPFW